MEEIVINYPLFYPCSLTDWETLEKQANALLGLPSEDGETYSRQFKDSSGNIYFYVSEDVVSLVDVSKCVTHEQINWPKLF